MQHRAWRRQTAWSCRHRSADELVKIRRAVLIRIIEVGLNPMDVPAQKDHIGEPLLEDGIDNDLPFPLEPRAIRAARPAVIARDRGPASLWTRQRHARDN